MPYDEYHPSRRNSSQRASSYKYDPERSAWVPVSSTLAPATPTYSYSPPKPSVSTPVANSGAIDTDTASKVNSKAQADKDYIEVEYNTLEGELSLIVSKKTTKIKVGDTVKIEGIGKYLSGLYYVSNIKRTIDNSGGYSHTITVIKTGFGEVVNNPSNSKKNDTSSTKPSSSQGKSSPTISKNLKVGDKVMFLTVASNKYTYSNASDGVPVPKWVTEKVHTVDGVSSDGKRVRLKEIWSWTYTKFLKKV